MKKIYILDTASNTAEEFVVVENDADLAQQDFWWANVGEQVEEADEEADAVKLEDVFGEDDLMPQADTSKNYEQFDALFFDNPNESERFVSDNCASCKILNCPANENQI